MDGPKLVPIICGSLTSSGRQCQRKVSQVGDHCQLHRESSATQRVRRALGLCWKAVDVCATFGGAIEVHHHIWPHVEPLIRRGAFYPEDFWSDDLDRARKMHGQRALDFLRSRLTKLQGDEEQLVRKVASLTAYQQGSAEAAFIRVARALAELESERSGDDDSTAELSNQHTADRSRTSRSAQKSMNYLKRYRNGEYERVWDELQALGPAVREEPCYSQAREVAAETMRRVRRNCELLVSRLRSAGYIFGTYPDGSRYMSVPEPLAPPSDATRAELEAPAGPVPLSLVAFWQEVGSVDLVGMHTAWPNGLDPLVVHPPEEALSLPYEEEVDEDTGASRWFAPLAPDDVHKDNESGGDPYGVMLPDAAADFLFLYERNNLLFVPYLRMAILRWGGFPGLDGSSGCWPTSFRQERAAPFEPLRELVAGLEPF